MINSFLRYKTKNTKNQTPSLSQIQQADKVLFALFTRYGDTIIDLVVIQEFIARYPDKDYLILCPRQMQPYVSKLLPNVECIVLNKRNLWDMLNIDRRLKKWQPDIGFNPWSNGLDSCYFLTYCKYYQCYKDFDRPQEINHYQVIRRYLQLPEKPWRVEEMVLQDDYSRVVVCPQSTDVYRSITKAKLDQVLTDIKENYQRADITIAAMDQSYFKSGCEQFVFKKTADSSQRFIELIQQADLVICSDSGPLHVASAFDKDVIGFFYVTKPEIVINTGVRVSYG